jgi:nodulation protein E
VAELSLGRSVAVTGLGIVSPVGHDLESFWERVCAGDSAIGEITNISTERLGDIVAAEIKDFDPATVLEGSRFRTMDRFAQFAVAAARSAVADAKLDLSGELSNLVAVILGSATGGQTTVDSNYDALYRRDAKRLPPLVVPQLMVNAAVSQVSMDLGLRGEAYAVASACASGTHAIGQAYRMVHAGITPVAVTGGAEASLTIGALKCWEALRVMGKGGCRPFSLDRNGMILGEGAAILILEDMQHAKERGARVYATIKGYGATADAADLTSPNVDQMARAIRRAVESAGISASEIDYINAHGTGTKINDACEAAAINKVFGRQPGPFVSSTKSVFGHCLGAAGALEAVVAILAIHRGCMPPNSGWREPDPECDLNIIAGSAVMAECRNALSNSFAFGGLNAALVMGRS